MPKYILGTNGKIINLEKTLNDDDREIEEVASEYAKKGGSHYKSNDLGQVSDIDLPTSFRVNDDEVEEHTVKKVKSPTKLGNSLFPKREFAEDHNSSFGADVGFDRYKNFNNYLQRQEIFASELEMIGTGIDLTGTFGFKDLSKFLAPFELIVEASVYILVIELILSAERSLDPDTLRLDDHDDIIRVDNRLKEIEQYLFKPKFGNYGPSSYTSITRYFNDILNYPVNGLLKSRKGLVGLFSEASDRLGAFFIGFMLYLNGDSLILYEKIKNAPLIGPARKSLLNQGSTDALWNGILLIIETISNLNNLESNRLKYLIRRFNQKSDWHLNRLFKAKEDTKYKDNLVEKYLVEFNYYYVKFIIERMNIGLKTKRYFRNKTKKNRRFDRSGKVKDSKNYLNSLSYSGGELTLAPVGPTPDRSGGDYKNNSFRQSISLRHLPQAFIKPQSLENSKSNADLGNIIAEDFVKSYFLSTEKPQERLSTEAVKTLEDYYEKEIMPFYFQDLRTNEIIGFHAFIESITDNFNPNYTQTKGFGRIDDVRHYVDTTRNVNITFALAAMSLEDHDLMWYQINKIVSMVYPQWSRGFKASKKDDPSDAGFEYPFTQVPTASPLIRIRLGDVIKSNYTKHSIQKIHGSGNSNERQLFKSYTDPNDGGDNLNNPITAAYKTTFGKGLAGFITMLDVNYQDQLWETKKGSRAPKLVKLTINFAPIHDIPPGLDADGAMRAPVYNTGRIVNSLYGEAYDILPTSLAPQARDRLIGGEAPEVEVRGFWDQMVEDATEDDEDLDDDEEERVPRRNMELRRPRRSPVIPSES